MQGITARHRVIFEFTEIARERDMLGARNVLVLKE
jgi:hypothetical protein